MKILHRKFLKELILIKSLTPRKECERFVTAVTLLALDEKLSVMMRNRDTKAGSEDERISICGPRHIRAFCILIESKSDSQIG
jgi:hypothetical protein